MNLSPAPSPTIALLVDAENLPRTHATQLLTQARHWGEPSIRRVYGNLNALSGWEDHGFRLCPTRPGKNAADMLLCVEAMALALRDGIGAIAIASSDRDFTYLAEYLREAGKTVIGLGSAKAAPAFRAACTHFITLATPPAKPAAAPSKPKATCLLDLVRPAVGKAGALGLPLQSLGAFAQRSGMKISSTPEKTWRAWLLARPDFFDLDPKGPNARVRLKV